MKGLHIIADLYNCPNAELLTSSEKLRSLCVDACRDVGLTVLGEHFYQFDGAKGLQDGGATGAKITITGENFGDAGCLSGVSFGPGSPAKFSQVDDKTITVTVPDGKRGLELLTVTGFTGEDSKPFLRK